MQYKFLTLYHDFDNKEKNLLDAQRDLLFDWWKRTAEHLCKKEKLSQVPFIPVAKVEFKDYSFFDYYDTGKAKQYVQDSYGHKRKKKDGGGFEYWWCGTQYPDLDTIYNALAEQKRFMELTITVED